MFNKVKECLSEIIDIADKCPEKYQVKCFEVLLSALVRPEISPIGAARKVPVAGGEAPVPAKPDFFSKYSITEEEWSRVFYFDGNSYSIIVKDLKDKRIAKKQIKLALLLGVKGLLESGEPAISKDSLVELCKEYSAFDSSNFATHMKHAKNLLSTKSNGWALTVPGKEEAAKIIKELAQ